MGNRVGLQNEKRKAVNGVDEQDRTYQLRIYSYSEYLSIFCTIFCAVCDEVRVLKISIIAITSS